MALAASLVPSALALDLGRTKTEIGIVESAVGAPNFLQLSFRAEIGPEIPDLRRDDVVAGWQEVGGIQPEPFRVLIPAGCFVSRRDSYFVEDFRTCGVQIVLGSAREYVTLTILDFDARVAARSDGSYRFDIMTDFYPPDAIIPPDAIVGALGGAGVRIGMGGQSAAAKAVRAATVSGVAPEPF
jgi:hypothetical protein